MIRPVVRPHGVERRRFFGCLGLAGFVVLLFVVVFAGSFWLDPAPHWVEAGRGTVIEAVQLQTIHYRDRHFYATTQELSWILPAGGCGAAYCYTMKVFPDGYVIRARPTALRRFVCWATRTKWPTFYADQTGVIHQSTGPEPATAASPTMPPGGGW